MLVRLAIVLLTAGITLAQNTITFKKVVLDKNIYAKNGNYALIGNKLFIPIELQDTIQFVKSNWAIAKINLSYPDTLEIYIWDKVDSTYRIGTILGKGDSLWIFLSYRDTVHIWLADTSLNIIKQWKARLYYWLGFDNDMNVYEAELIEDTLLILSAMRGSNLYPTIAVLNIKQGSGHWYYFSALSNVRYAIGSQSIALIGDRNGYDSAYIGWLNLDTFAGTLRLYRFFVNKRLNDYGFLNIEDALSGDTVAFVLGLMKGAGLLSNDAVFWRINSSGVGYREVQGSVFRSDLPCGIEYVNDMWVYVSASLSKSKLFVDINSTLSGENSISHKIVYSGISAYNCRTVSFNNDIFVYSTTYSADSRELTLARIPVPTDKVCPGYNMETITDSAGVTMQTFQALSTFHPFIDSPTSVIAYSDIPVKAVEKWTFQSVCLPNAVIIPELTDKGAEVKTRTTYIEKIAVTQPSQLTIIFDKFSTVEIFDITGRLVYRYEGTTINLYLQPGIYIIRSSQKMRKVLYD